MLINCFLSTSMVWFLGTLGLIYCVIRWFLWKLTIGGYDQRYVLITGCDMGFGNLLARRLTSMGFNVFAGCLTKEGVLDLQNVGSNRLKAFQLDVTKKEDIETAKQFVQESLPKDKGLWALVNNAGILGSLAFLDCLSREHYEKVLNVNMYGTIEMTMAFLPLIRQAEGRIVNVASVVGFVSLPVGIPYNVSKYAVEAFSDGLRRLVKHQNVSVHMLEPGLHGTHLLNEEFVRNGIHKDFKAASKEVQDYYGEKSLDTYSWMVCKLMVTFTSSKLDKVINAHIHAITALFPKTRYLVGIDANFIFWPLKIMPDWLSDFILKTRFLEPTGLKKKKIS